MTSISNATLEMLRGSTNFHRKLRSGITSKEWGAMVNDVGGLLSGMLDVLVSVTIRIMRYRGFSNITKLINIRTKPSN